MASAGNHDKTLTLQGQREEDAPLTPGQLRLVRSHARNENEDETKPISRLRGSSHKGVIHWPI